MIGVVERDEAFRMTRCDIDFRRILDTHRVVERRVHDEQRTAERRDARALVLRPQIVDQPATDAEAASRQQDVGRPLGIDRRDCGGIELVERVRDVEGGVDRRDRADRGEIDRGGNRRRAAQAVADQQRWRLAFVRKRPRSGLQILHVEGKATVGEIALAVAKPRKVEAQHADSLAGETTRNPHGGAVVLAAGEAVCEDRPAANASAGMLHPARQGLAGRT